MYQAIQQLNFGNTVETLLAIILGFGSLIAAIELTKWILKVAIKSDFAARFLSFTIVVIGLPSVLYFKFDYEIQPLMYFIMGIYAVIWLLREAYLLLYLNHAE